MSSATQKELWSAVAYVNASQNRTTVLKHLESKPQAATDIASKTPLGRQVVSVTIGHMREESDMGDGEYNIVQCLTPDRPNYRIYGLTELGEQVAEQLD